MQGDSLQFLKSPHSLSSQERLEKYGMALEYFENFEQIQHEFHSHDFIEILYVIRGQFRHITADQTYDERRGGLTIMNFKQFHSLKTSSGPVELMNVYINPKRFSFPELPDLLAERLYELIPIHKGLENRLNSILHMDIKDPEKTASLLMMLLDEQKRDNPASNEAQKDLFRLFLIELCRAAPVIKKNHSNAYFYKMELVRKFIEKNFREAIRLEELCQLTGLNASNLCRRFKDYSGTTIGDFIKQRRLAAAIQRLRSGNDKILVISQDCGFTDVSRFNRFFKQAFSCSPSEFRKNRDLPAKL